MNRNNYNLPEFIAQRNDGKFIVVEVKNQNEPDIGNAIDKFEDVVSLIKEMQGRFPGMGSYRIGNFILYVRTGFRRFNDALFTIDQKTGLLLKDGQTYRIDGILVQIKVRDLVPQS